MKNLPKKWLHLPLMLLLLLSLAACGGDEETEDTVVTDMELIARSSGDVVADTHGNHWHGSLPQLEVDGSHLSLGANFLNTAGEEVEIDWSTYILDARVDDGDADLVEINSHGDHLHLVPGAEEGDVGLVFLLTNGDVRYESPVITLIVSEDPEEDGDHDHGDHDHEDDDHGDHDHEDDDHGDHDHED